MTCVAIQEEGLGPGIGPQSKKGGPKLAISPTRSRLLAAFRAASAFTTPTRSWPGSWRSASSNIWSASASSSYNAGQSGVARRAGAASRADPSADRLLLPPKAARIVLSCGRENRVRTHGRIRTRDVLPRTQSETPLPVPSEA
jgi:hypothetical protein